jgi:hypothetical protein
MLEFVKRVFGLKDKTALEGIRKYQQVYNDPAGRWVLEDILKNLCNYGGSCIGVDEQSTNLKLGAQNVGIEIAQRLTANISEIEEELKEIEEIEDDE